MPDDPDALLAVDLGLRAGLAAFGRDGRVRWYRSTNFGARGRMKSALYKLVPPSLEGIVLEGGGDLAELWQKQAQKRGVPVRQVQAHVWRRDLLHPSERRSGADAKATADTLARRVIAWSGASAPTSLRHDAAEAILTGFWYAHTLGWLSSDDVDAALRG